MSLLDELLGGRRWYRRWRGGRWWLCEARYEFRGLRLWVHVKPPPYILVVRIEQW